MAVTVAIVYCSYSDLSVLFNSDVRILQVHVCVHVCVCVRMCVGVCVVDGDSCIHMYICPCKCMLVIMSNYM